MGILIAIAAALAKLHEVRAACRSSGECRQRYGTNGR